MGQSDWDFITPECGRCMGYDSDYNERPVVVSGEFGETDESAGRYWRRLTQGLPCRLIPVARKPYLERYILARYRDGKQHWLHHFAGADTDRNFHTHPWYACSTILCGGYVEERLLPDGQVVTTHYTAGDRNILTPDTLHKVVHIAPGTWTLMEIAPGWRDRWHFIGESGHKETVVKEYGENDCWWAGCCSCRREYSKLLHAGEIDFIPEHCR